MDRVSSSGEAAAQNARAAQLEAAGDLAGALQAYTRALDLDPRNLAALVNRAGVQIAMAEYGKAFADFRAALEIDPEHWPALYNRAVVYHGFAEHFLMTGEHEKAAAQASGALADQTHVLQLRPDLADAHLARAKAYVARSRAYEASGDLAASRADIAAAAADVDEALRRAPAEWPSRDEAGQLRAATAGRAGSPE